MNDATESQAVSERRVVTFLVEPGDFLRRLRDYVPDDAELLGYGYDGGDLVEVRVASIEFDPVAVDAHPPRVPIDTEPPAPPANTDLPPDHLERIAAGASEDMPPGLRDMIEKRFADSIGFRPEPEPGPAADRLNWSDRPDEVLPPGPDGARPGMDDYVADQLDDMTEPKPEPAA